MHKSRSNNCSDVTDFNVSSTMETEAAHSTQPHLHRHSLELMQNAVHDSELWFTPGAIQ